MFEIIKGKGKGTSTGSTPVGAGADLPFQGLTARIGG
jgi:hypothetical protein